MGLLLHGLPGCGKTSTIKAIANHTQRHIVSVPLNRIKTSKHLLDIFYQEQLNHMNVPLSKRLYVIEDIDCSELKDIVRDRSSSEDQDSGVGGGGISDEDAQNFLNLIKVSSNKTMDKLDKDKKELTLAGLLEVLDGVMEMDGRMMVITTNYPDRLDAALTRPGRVDLKLKFGRCTNKCLIEMYEHFFNDKDILSLWPENFDMSQVPNDRWTPAEATQILLNNIHDPQQGLLQLVNEFPQAKDTVDIADQK
jgi:chaperone BCS1